MIDIYLLQQLVSFAECGTLLAASEKLHTSQPAMTRSMKKLEQELGVPLFVRSKNHLALNETGMRAAEYARRVLEADAEFESRVRAFDRSLHTLSVGFCAPVPQAVLTPILNNVFGDMTISADMMDDADFLNRLENGTYQLAVTHFEPKDSKFYYKKCGHEDLFISVHPGNPLTFYPKIGLKDLDGLSILLLSRIGFWANTHRAKTPNSNYLLQVEADSFEELVRNSEYPAFSSSYYIRRNETFPDRINIPITDDECHTDFYLICMKEETDKYKALFRAVTDKTIF